MKIKLLDRALLLLFAGAAPCALAQPIGVQPVPAATAAGAQPAAPSAVPRPAASSPPAAAASCTESGCQADGQLLFQLQTRGKRAPAGDDPGGATTDEKLQPSRRVTIESAAPPQPTQAQMALPGKAVASGRFSVQLPGGGVIWATEDPTLGVPELSVSGPALLTFDNGRIKAPVPFFVRSNYPGFIRRYELTLYRATDTDLTEPLASVPVPVAAVSRGQWDGQLRGRSPLRAGDSLIYVLRAFGENGAVDETVPRVLQLVRPEDAERGDVILRDSAERSLGTALSTQQAQAQRLIDNVFTSNDLRQQNIEIYGSRIRIQGRNLPAEHSLRINGEDYPVDLERKFVAEFLSPIGKHRFDLALKNAEGKTTLAHTLDVDVSGEYFFGVGIADLTLAQNKATGPGADLARNGRTDDVLADGRLAFYGKAKIDGKYLITGQADTQERDVRDLFSGFTKAEPRDIFRRLDPNQYYPTYGDDSSTYRDVDTQGRLYLRADWDKNQALWGNFYTGLTGTEYAQYVRSLYGAAVSFRSNATNPWGEPKTFVRAFASEAQSAPGHSEFIGTGGSLYYLRHTDILRGSDVVTLEVRNPATGRVENRVTLVRGKDYDINELQGRLMLARPLTQHTTENINTITRDAPLSGLEQRLIVDYEWVPTQFDAGKLAAGVRAKQWVGDHVAVGATLVDEKRAGDNYTLAGADLTLQAGRGSFLKLEHSKTEATGTPVFFSTNGGLSFTRANDIAGRREGTATAISAQANLKELGWTDRGWSLGAWWRKVDAGYSVARNDTGLETREVGAQVRGQVTDDLAIYGVRSRVERGAESLDQTQLTAEWRPTDNDTVSAEVRRLTQQRTGGDVNGTLGALKYERRVDPSLDVYGIVQKTLDNDGGRYADNDAVTAGARYRLGAIATLGAEATHGDRGDAAQINGEYRLSPEHTLYGAFTHSTDTSEYDAIFNPRLQGGWTLGQRWRLGEKSNLFNESQYIKDPNTGNGLANTFGMDFYPAVGWSLGFTLQQGELQGPQGDVHRRAVSVNAGRTSPDTEWASKIEWRRDSGAEERTQWVTTNRINRKLDESLRVSAKLNYADTQDRLNAAASAKYVEAGTGFAWRPYDSARYALLGRFTYLYDLATLGQVGASEYDQKSQIVSLEGTYRLDRQWEFAAKVARRSGEARLGRGTGTWFDSSTNFVSAQARYELPEQWRALAEYRVLAVKDGGTRSGWLLGADRDIGKNLRVGVGYNFTDFSDDLTKFDYKYKGFFVNLVGSY